MDKSTAYMLLGMMFKEFPKLPTDILQLNNGNWVININFTPLYVVRTLDDWDKYKETHLVLLKACT